MEILKKIIRKKGFGVLGPKITENLSKIVPPSPIPSSLLPPRRVVIERLPEQPTKPQDVCIERWLPFKDVKRKITLRPRPNGI